MEQNLKTTITELIHKMGLSLGGVETNTLLGQTVFSIETQDSALLIGKRGEALRALTLIVKKIGEQQGLDPKTINIDINGYHREKIEKLETQAKTLAERARTLKCDIEMNPMNAYERMIVHEALRDEVNIKTHSQGEGPLRHVTISFVEH